MNKRPFSQDELIIGPPRSKKHYSAVRGSKQLHSWSSEYGSESGVQRGIRRALLSWGGGLVLGGALFWLGGNLLVIQVIHGVENRDLADTNRVRRQIIPAARGLISDSKGQPLVRNNPGFQVALDLPVLRSSEQFEAVRDYLQERLNLSSESLATLEAAKNSFQQERVVLATNLERDAVLEIESNLSSLPGVVVEAQPIREYLYPEALAGILGYIGEVSAEELGSDRGFVSGDLVGRAGVEAYFDSLLRGRNGQRLVEVSSSGESFKHLATRPAVPGSDLYLTIDLDLQQVVYTALLNGVARSGASGGAVVVQDPHSGSLLALATYPSYNPNLLSVGISAAEYEELLSGSDQPFLNRALAGAYPPGSVFKIVTATAALSEGVITSHTLVNDTGQIAVGGFVYRGWLPGGHGQVSVVRALAESSDVFFYIVGGGYQGFPGLGIERLASWSRKFGFGSRSGIELYGEVAGLVPDPAWKEEAWGESWYLGNTYHIAIGQGDLLTTPLQISNMMSAVVNGGILYRPLIKAGDPPEIIGSQIASPEVLETVKEGLRGATQVRGTAYLLQDLPVLRGGKTGTAEFGVKRGEEFETHAWFTGFAPFENPEVVVTVFLEGGGEGSDDAVPVAREILEKWLDGKENGEWKMEN